MVSHLKMGQCEASAPVGDDLFGNTAADSHTGSKVESGKESRTCFEDCQCPFLKERGGLRKSLCKHGRAQHILGTQYLSGREVSSLSSP